jgi:hypothetical protein
LLYSFREISKILHPDDWLSMAVRKVFIDARGRLYFLIEDTYSRVSTIDQVAFVLSLMDMDNVEITGRSKVEVSPANDLEGFAFLSLFTKDNLCAFSSPFLTKHLEGGEWKFRAI